jgi:hypothetical protein
MRNIKFGDIEIAWIVDNKKAALVIEQNDESIELKLGRRELFALFGVLLEVEEALNVVGSKNICAHPTQPSKEIKNALEKTKCELWRHKLSSRPSPDPEPCAECAFFKVVNETA